jgi:methionine--tRNA ligase beta chain
VRQLVEISFKLFQQLDLRVGRIVEASQIPGSRNLIKMIVDFGTERRQAIAGILKWYSPDSLIDRKCAFILNLERRKIMGVESQCMILAAEDPKGYVTILQPDKNIIKGSTIH